MNDTRQTKLSSFVDWCAAHITGDEKGQSQIFLIDLKTLGINPRGPIKQIVDYKNDPGNGSLRTQECIQ